MPVLEGAAEFSVLDETYKLELELSVVGSPVELKADTDGTAELLVLGKLVGSKLSPATKLELGISVLEGAFKLPLLVGKLDPKADDDPELGVS
jgi:hypothetical protein